MIWYVEIDPHVPLENVEPYMGTMVTVAGGDEVPPEYRAARIAQERYDLERSVEYCRQVLGIGE